MIAQFLSAAIPGLAIAVLVLYLLYRLLRAFGAWLIRHTPEGEEIPSVGFVETKRK